MRTLKIASVLALCGAANLAHAGTVATAKSWKSVTSDTRFVCWAETKDTTLDTMELYTIFNPERNNYTINVTTNYDMPSNSSELTVFFRQSPPQTFTLPRWKPNVAGFNNGRRPNEARRLMNALRRGQTATLTTNSPNGYPVKFEFSLMGATAMTNDAATRCGLAHLIRPTRQARTTSQQRQHQTQTTSQYEEDGVDQILDAVTDTITDTIINDVFGDFGF